MADDSLKKLLIKLGISTADWQKSVKDIKAQLKEMQNQALKDFQDRQAQQRKEIDLTKQQIADQQKLRAEAQAMASVDKAKAAWQQQQAAAIKTKVAQSQLETAEVKKQGVEQSNLLKIEQQKLQIKQQELRLEQSQLALERSKQRAEGGGRREGGEPERGVIGGALRGLSSGLFGGGLIGAVAAGTAAGELFEKVLEKLGERIRDIGKEMLEAAGPAGALREQFEKLAKREKTDPEEFLNELRVATRGLVEDNTQLIKVANQFMSGPLKLEPEQIVKLTGLTVNLARATAGSPNSVETAMQALSRTALTGRAYQLAYAVGIDTTQLRMQGLGKEAQTTAGRQVQLSMIMDAMQRRFSEVGTPMTTVKDLYSQLGMASSAFNEDLAYGVTHSTAFAGAIETISKWLMKVTPDVLDFAKAVGEHLGEAFYAVQTFINNVLVPLGQFEQSVQRSYQSLLQFIDVRPPDVGWKETMADMALGFISTVYWIEKATTKLQTYAGIAVAVAGGDFKAVEAIYKEGQEKITKLDAQLTQDIVKNMQFRTQQTQIDVGEAGPAKKVPTQEEANIAKQIAAVNLKIKEEEEKRKLDLVLARIEEEKNANKEAYEGGLVSIQEFVSKERAILEKEHDAKLAMIHADANARRAALDQESKGMTYKDMEGKVTTLPGMDPGLKAAKQREIAASENAQVEAENLRAGKEQYANQKQILQDQIAARREYVNAINKIEQDGVKERIRILDEEFKQGVGTADSYLTAKRGLIEQEYQLRVEALAQEEKANKDNAQELAKVRIQFVEAEMQKEKELQELEEHEGTIRLESIKTRYQQAKEILSAEAIQAQQEGPLGEGKSETGAIQAEQLLTVAYLQRLQNEQSDLEKAGKMYTSEWVSINKEIYSAVQEQMKLNTEMAKAKDWAGALGGLLGTVAQEFGSILGPGGSKTMETLAKSLESLSKVQTGIAAQTGGLGGLFKSTGRSITDLFHHTTQGPQKAIQTAQEIFENGLKSAAAKVTDFGEAAVKTVQKFSDGIVTTGDKLGKDFSTATTKIDTAATRTGKALDALTAAAANASKALRATGGGAPLVQPTDFGLKGKPTVPGETVDVTATQEEVQPTLEQLPAQLPTTETGGATGALDKFSTMLDKATGAGDDFANKFKDVIGKISGIVQSVMSVVSNVMGAKSTGGGIMAGGLSGAAFGANFGPWGAAIGAAVGAISGGIVGHKQAQVQKDMADIKTHLQAIQDNLQNGTVSLGASITQLQSLRSSTMSSLGGSKKGQKALPGILQTINDQLNQLLQQQKQLLDELHNQVSILDQPQAYQQILTSLDDIVKKYQEFASAAVGNTQEVTNANQWLVKSLQNYATTLTTEVNSAEQQAIQNKIQLIDLQQQQFQMTAAYNQQVYDIQTAGVTTRQRTTAMSKGEQLAQAKYQYDQQKQQIDAEINLTQMKVDAESKIFNLAKNRVDLEMQLLSLQAAQESLSVQHIQALQQTLGKLTSALGPGGTVPAGLFDATGGVNIQAIEQLLGLPITAVSGAAPGQATIQNMPPIYQEFVDTVGKDPQFANFGAQLLAAAATPFGSAQRQSLLNVMREPAFGADLVAAGVVSKPVHGVSTDPNWISFFNWVLDIAQTAGPGASGGGAGTIIPTPGLLSGGQVERTGTAVVHEGEGVFSVKAVPIFQKMVDGMAKFGDVIASMGDKLSSAASGGVFSGTPGITTGPISLSDPTLGGTLQVHQTIYDLSAARVAMESGLADKQTSVIALEMQRIAAIRSLMSEMQGSNYGVTSLEGAYAKLYELRGRMGAGGFTRENI